MKALSVVLFVLALAFCLSPWGSPPLALAIGLVLAFTTGHPFAGHLSKITKILLQTSVVLLGFGMNLHTVVSAGKTGMLFTIGTIAGTLTIGLLAGRLLGLDRTIAHLISSGTAICGGSAIAAVGPVMQASDEQMSVALGTVFVLNAIALFIFPPIGHYLSLTQTQFGVWAAIAIHDTSSVVGAAARYGKQALDIATAVKLTRALWIVPLTLVTAALVRKAKAKIAWPWFILWFVVASVVRTIFPSVPLWPLLTTAARLGLTVTLLLIGAGLSRKNLKSVGPRPLVLGVLLWIVISTVSLWVVRSTLS